MDDRERSSDVDLVVDALRQLPIGHEVEWGDRHQRLTASVWRASWIDVVVPDVCEHVGMNWLWTIVTPDDGDAPDEPADSTTIALAPDCDVHTWIDPETGWFAETGPVHVTAPGVPVSDEQHAEIAAHGKVTVTSGWTLDAVNAALHNWAATVAGRADLQFRFDDHIDTVDPATLDALDALERMQETGETPSTYLVSDGIYATDQVIDTLLGLDPDQAAHLMRQIRDAIDDHRRGNGY